ncbi:MAG: Dipeptide transport system permease protein DppC [Devosia sp.]|uniref:ABC transporter permease n=1 Tax=Devosia sp. TaxID=1871048 RepID=UPI00261FEF17|nr:ABC transporter permease [Devosia sp.]MDB5531058.1 Dipeptide transport system permease protein DppC [Devosia sp.]
MTLVLPTASPRRKANFTAYELTVFGVVAALFLLALIGPMIAPADIYTSNMLETLFPPSAEHWLGTDDQGRDIFWRLIAGSQLSLFATVLVVILYSIIGMIVATLATVGPRWVDELLMRVTDIGLSLPGLVVSLGIATVLGPSLQSGIIALALTGWPMTARILRTTMRQTMEQPFVEGARILGVSRTRLMLKHVLPNSLDVLIVKWAGDISFTMLILAGLSFIGVGAQPPSPEWGAMISGARGNMSIAWWAVAAPGAAIVINAVAFALLADILQVRRDPSLRA